MKNKKSDVAVSKLIGLALGVIALVVMSIFVYQQIKGEKEEVSKWILASTDSDEDGIPDIYDKCDCVPGTEENDGCPIGVDITKSLPDGMTNDDCISGGAST